MYRPHTVLPETLGVHINDLDLLRGAVMHLSYRYEHPNDTAHAPDTQRLEFLGDAVVNIVATQLVYHTFPTVDEGGMTRLRSALICTESLAEIAQYYDLGSFLILSKGEDHMGARQRPALLADVFESIVAVIFLDQGMAAAHAFLHPHFSTRLAQFQQHGIPIDARSALQEQAQRRFGITPRYQTVSMSGPDHQRTITVAVQLHDQVLGQGIGNSHATARQQAAEQALQRLDDVVIPPKPSQQSSL
jgi:ribonuclease-3